VAEIIVLDAATGAERQIIAEPVELAGLTWLDGTHVLAARSTATTQNTQLTVTQQKGRGAHRRTTP
jgi:hypothetical protein